MTNLADALTELGDALAKVSAAALADGGLRGSDDVDVLRRARDGGPDPAQRGSGHGRGGRGDRWTATVASVTPTGHDAVRLPQHERTRATRDARLGAHGVRHASPRRTRCEQPVALSTGEVLPAEFPGLRAALGAGQVGLDGMIAVTGAFRGCQTGRAEMLAADAELAAAACGEGVDAAPPASADELRALAQVWAAYLDQDGAEPEDTRALRKRGITVGRRGDDGLVPLRGRCSPNWPRSCSSDSTASSIRASTAHRHPGRASSRMRTAIHGEPVASAADQRSHAQKQHDAFAVLLDGRRGIRRTADARRCRTHPGRVGAGGGPRRRPRLTPTSPATTSRSRSRSPGTSPAPAPSNASCWPRTAGSCRSRPWTASSTTTSAKRSRSATVCVIPGCPVPPQWCEIHHVEEHSRGGPTHTDNGVLLCWFHHRTIDTGGWQIRMVDGIPYVKGPYWWDAQVKWRPATKSPTRRRDQLALRL